MPSGCNESNLVDRDGRFVKMSESTSSVSGSTYGWVIVVLAALAMIGTLPGRTHGLGMITERLLNDSSLNLDRTRFGYMNLWATLIGAAFCFPAGWMLDRIGIRITATLVVGLLGVVVLAMTTVVNPFFFAILITLTRGLGQSALSVVSISMTGKWFKERLPLATGLYSVLISMGFAAAFLWGRSQSDLDWRTLWQYLGGILLFVLTPLFAIFVCSPPVESTSNQYECCSSDENDFLFSEALATPAFWLFGIAISLYGLVQSGISLFNESLLVERGFPKTAFYDLGTMTTGIGLLGNLFTGVLATRIRITLLAAVAMGLLATALMSLPFVSSYPELVAYAVTMGYAGGMVTVLFFTVWARLFGRTHLGRIQSVAQMLTVLASALGPVVLAEVKARTGSYLPAIVCLGAIAAVLSVAVAFVPIPIRRGSLSFSSNLEPAVST